MYVFSMYCMYIYEYVYIMYACYVNCTDCSDFFY